MEAPHGAARSSSPSCCASSTSPTDALAEAREEIDALNVYPVPDGDTGTNMFLTVSAARDALREADRRATPTPTGARRWPRSRRGALLGARGNSGVILSQMLGAIGRRIAAARARTSATPRCMAEALQRGRRRQLRRGRDPGRGHHPHRRAGRRRRRGGAARPTRRPGPGTCSPRPRRPPARRSRARPEQLDGPRATPASSTPAAAGLSVILDAAETVLTGRRPTPVTTPIGHAHDPDPARRLPEGDLTAGRPGLRGDVPARRRRRPDPRPARRRSPALGDSLVVVGGEGLWNVHVHVDDVGAAIEAGIDAGRPHRIRVTHFAEQVAEVGAPRPRRPQRAAARSSPSPPAPASRALFDGGRRRRRRGRSRAGARRPASCSRRSPPAERPRSIVLPNDPDSVARGRDRRAHRRGGPRASGSR